MCDGDKLLVLRDKLLIKIAKRNMQGIVPLYYEMKKAKGGLLNSDSIYEGMKQAFTTGNIGPISNNITRTLNCGKDIEEEQLNVVKWLCMYNNFVIDSAKTLYIPTPPKDIDKIIKSYTRLPLPNFFIYAKDKLLTQVAEPNNSTMNRIAAKIPNPKIKFSKTISKFDYRMLMNLNYNFDLSENNEIIQLYDWWNKRQNIVFNISEEETHLNQEDLYVFQQIRENILSSFDYDINYIVNTLIIYLYTIRPTSTKKLLWACFGKEIVNNLQENTKSLGRICQVCGKRFEPKVFSQLTCSPKCGAELNRRKQFARDHSLDVKDVM